ncbi:hypothetical protein FE782_05100 [Paenibacillus antri]|uniref:Fibronectin type-III domain-containing protein n=1 Tax=Paenibacillus antri TaxID=2582848 RepID=A0A5R9GD34_9BACL|nr:hypothetical protein [Paenibacillus antri]TLS53651.1 hypothetical protein FE782_05100 [Paenibacillus antri]
MKTRKRAALGLIAFLMMLSSLTVASPARANETVSTIEIDPSSVVTQDFLGIGAEYDPFHFMPESVGNGYNEQWWEIEKRRIAKMQPDILRLWFQIDWMEPVNDNADPNVIDWSNLRTDSPKMQSVYKVLDFLKEQDIDVMLVAGWKMSEEVQDWLGFEGLPKPETSAPTDLDEWAEWVSATLQQLVVNRGYDNIRYVMSYNEPNLADFETPPGIDQKAYYAEMYRKIHERLVTDGVRHLVKLAGPDESSGLDWTQYAVDRMDDILDVYDGHAYGYNYSSLGAWANDRLQHVRPTGKPLVITEFAAPGTKTTYQNGVELADLIVSGMRSNVSGMLLWRLADQHLPEPLNFLDSAEFGTWSWLPNSALPRYTYYSLSLFTWFTAPHSQVVRSTSNDGDLHVATVKRPDGHYAVFVVNKAKTGTKQVSIQFAEAVNQTFRRHLYSDETVRTASASIRPSDASWPDVSAGFLDSSVPANSVAVYTTAPEPTQIEIAPGELSAALGAGIDFEGAMTGTDGDMAWSVVGGPAYGTIDAEGGYTAPLALPAEPQALIKAERAGAPDDRDFAVVRLQVVGATAFGDDAEVRLTWAPSLGAQGYNVKRSETANGPYTTVAAGVAGTSYVDTGLENRKTYYYVISAVNGYGEAADSKPVSATLTSNSMEDAFDGKDLDLTQWELVNQGLRSTLPTGIEADVTDGALRFQGTSTVNYWGGRGAKSAFPFFATPERHLIVEVDRLSLEGQGTAQNSALWLYINGSQSLRFSQYSGNKQWVYNYNGGGDTLVYAGEDAGNHKMKFVHDGVSAHIFVDGHQLTSVPVGWNSNMRIILGAEARASGDTIDTKFDNVRVYTDRSPVEAPANLQAVAGGARVRLSWSAVPDADGYTVKRRSSSRLPFETVADGVVGLQYADFSIVSGATYEYVVTAVRGGKESLHSNRATAVPKSLEATVDNPEAEKIGAWTLGAGLPNYIGANYAVHSTGAGDHSLRWRPNLPMAGAYAVYYNLPNGNADRSTNAPYTVHYHGGSETFLVDQQGVGGEWKRLGVFDFLAGDSGYVEITDRANGKYVIADAVKFVKVDDIAPVTTAEALGEERNGWYVAEATVTLTATDSLSDVERTEYRWNGGSWETYEGPLHVTEEGEHLLEFRSIDEAGNAEAPQSSTIAIDATPPSLEWLGVEEGATYIGAVTPSANASDPWSGVASLAFELDGSPWSPGAPIEEPGPHVLKATATDRAGHAADAEIRFTVKDAASLRVVGDPLKIGAGPHSLSAQVDPTEPNDRANIGGLPVRMSLWRLDKDFAWTSVTEDVYATTSEEGLATVELELSDGLYLVKAELQANDFFVANEPALSFAVVKNSQRPSGAEGRNELPPAFTGTMTLDLREYGLEPKLKATGWTWVGGNTLQAEGRHGQESYAVQLLFQSTDPEPNATLRVWEGFDTTAAPIVDVPSVPFAYLTAAEGL